MSARGVLNVEHGLHGALPSIVIGCVQADSAPVAVLSLSPEMAGFFDSRLGSPLLQEAFEIHMPLEPLLVSSVPCIR